jgi:hypothetical protein
MFKEIIGAITVILLFVGIIPYIIDIFKGITKPHVLTWLIWSVVTIAAFIAQWQQGGGAGSWTTTAAGLATIFITILSFFKGSKDIAKSDVIIFIAALLSLIPWYFTHNPTLSAILITIIDALGFLPTIRKTFHDPSSETLISYIVHTIRHSLSIFALSNYNIATYFYPLILAIMNLIIIGEIIYRRKKII